jgi:hypothetical protein
VAPGARVNGVITPESVNPVPVSVTAEIVTDAVPVELSVTTILLVVPSVTLPKLTAVMLALSPGVVTATGLSVTTKVAEPFNVAVTVAVVEVVTAPTLAVNVAVDAPAATVTVGGTARLGLLLLKLTAVATVVASFIVTVQESVPVPVMAEAEQFNN